MNRPGWIGITGMLWALLFAQPAAGDSWATFHGTVLDGTPDYSDEAFKPMEKVAVQMATGDQNDPKLWDSFEKALMHILCPNGPVVDVRVTLQSKGGNPEERETQTDSKGQFHFMNLEIGEYEMTVFKTGKEGLTPEAFTWHLFIDGEYHQSGATLTLPDKFVTAQGRVTDSGGQPLAGVKIQALEYRYNGELGRWSSVRHEVDVLTDAAGNYEIPGLRPTLLWLGDGGPAGYILKVEGNGFVSDARKIDVIMPDTVAALVKWAKLMFGNAPQRGQKDWRSIKWPIAADAHGILDGVDFTLFRPASVGGCVRNATGAPVTNAAVWFRYLDAPPYQPMPFSLGPGLVKTDESGRYCITGLATGRYQAVVTVDGRSREYRDTQVNLHEGEVRTNLDLCYEVPPVCRVEASVFEKGNGSSIGVYTAYVERIDGPPDSGITDGILVKDTNIPGDFTVKNVSPGTVQIRISAPGYVSRRVACVVESGKPAVCPIELEPAGAALVHVTCNGVATRPYELVSFPEGSTNAVWGWSRTTNAAGRCLLQGLPQGLNRIRAQWFGKDVQSRYVLVSTQIEAGKTNAVELETEGPCSFDLDLAFPTNAVVRSWVEPVDAPVVEAFDANVDMKVYLWAYDSGRIAVTNLPAGEYRVGVQKLESTKGVEHVPLKADQIRNVQLDEGQRPAVAFEF